MASPSNSSTPSRHGKNPGSFNRGALPRRSTRGPLDITQSPVSAALSPALSQVSTPTRGPLSPARSPSRRPVSPLPRQSVTEHGPRDFARLLRPEIYHPLTQLEIPPPFRSSSKQPSPETPLQGLLATGHFRAAAIAAANRLTISTSPSDSQAIFELLYIRLVCLTLCGSTALASQEVKALEDLNSSAYHDELTGRHIVPWELRILAVRLQGMGFNDPRRSVTGLYDLARDAREEITRLRDNPHADEERKQWEAKLSDLGLRVASAMVEMYDFDGAAHHLSTLKSTDNEHLGFRKALLWLRIGDSAAARRCVSGSDSESIIAALCAMADGEYIKAVDEWKSLSKKDGDNEMYAQNLAVCLLYSGKMEEARHLLEKLVDNGKQFHTLTFNLSTIYELCTDRSRVFKVKLAEQVATMSDNDGSGWEKSNADFKL